MEQHEVNQRLRAVGIEKLFDFPPNATNHNYAVFRFPSGNYLISVGYVASDYRSAKVLELNVGTPTNPNVHFPLTIDQWRVVQAVASDK